MSESRDRRHADEETMKKVMKEALKEWLDEQYAKFGRWSLAGIACMALVVVTYLALKFAGWSPPPSVGN